MENQVTTPISQRPLDRRGYALRGAAYLAAFVGYGAIMGLIFGPKLFTDRDTFALFMTINTVVNVVLGIYFVLNTYRRALDTKFAKNGFAILAAVAALPTLALPNLSVIIFIVMMFFKSAPVDEEESDIEDDEGVLRPLEAAE